MTLVDGSRKIISDPLNVYLIFYGDWSYAMPTVRLIERFIGDLSQSRYFTAATNNYSGADNRMGTNTVIHKKTVLDRRTLPVTYAEGSRHTTDDIIEHNIRNGNLPVDPLVPSNLIADHDGEQKLVRTAVYCVILASTIRVDMEYDNNKQQWRGSDSCAWHGMTTLDNGYHVLSIHIMNVNASGKRPDGTIMRHPNGDIIKPYQNCSTLFALRNYVHDMPDKNSITTTPHNDNVGESCCDALVHELVEVITDPSSASKEWVQTTSQNMYLPRVGDASIYHLENADLCAYNYGRIGNDTRDGSINRLQRTPNGSYTNVELKPGRKYFLPTMFIKEKSGKAPSTGKCLFGYHPKKK